MTHTYQLTGMTCGKCEAKVKSALFTLNDVLGIETSLGDKTVTITMDKHIPLSVLQNVLNDEFQISAVQHSETMENTKSWFKTYKPVLLIFLFISGVTMLIQAMHNQFEFGQWMNHFMAGFFITFSFFKMLDLKAFAESYVMYDVIASKIPAWAYLYAFVELALGIAYLIDFNPFITNLVTVIVMTVSIIGVLKSVLNKKKIQCACLGAVFNLPMSTVTIIEDGLMIAMSFTMLLINNI